MFVSRDFFVCFVLSSANDETDFLMLIADGAGGLGNGFRGGLNDTETQHCQRDGKEKDERFNKPQNLPHTGER